MENQVNSIINEIYEFRTEIDYKPFESLVEEIVKANKVFVGGAGRSGDIIKCFAKRLMHAGIDSNVIGETVTPPAKAGDLLIIGSGSGETESLLIIANKAKNLGVKIALITTQSDSSIAKIADHILIIPASTPKSKKSEVSKSNQPMANLFEQTLLIVGDAMGIEVGKLKGLTYTEMFSNHANLE